MAIEIAGQTTGAERDAAESLKRRLEPALRPQDRIVIIAGAKCYGEKTEDIDLLVIGQFSPAFRLPTTAEEPGPAYLSNFLLVIEVKDHDGAAVRFECNQVKTRYTNRWHDASDQVFKQVFSLRNYLEKNLRINAPPIFKAIWLRNVERAGVPEKVTQILPAGLTAPDFFRVLKANSARWISIDAISVGVECDKGRKARLLGGGKDHERRT